MVPKCTHANSLATMINVLMGLHCCAAGEIGGGSAAESKGEQANSLQRAAGEATGRDGAQIPDKMQDIGQASGALTVLLLVDLQHCVSQKCFWLGFGEASEPR